MRKTRIRLRKAIRNETDEKRRKNLKALLLVAMMRKEEKKNVNV